MTDEDEGRLWQRMTHDVKPLKKKKSAAKTPADRPRKKKEPAAPAKAGPVERIVIKPATLKAIATPPREAPQLDKRTETKLKKGQIAIEGTLDLHGMTQARAHDALSNFIIAAQKAGKRCVLVITGKGNSKRGTEDWLESKPGILKQKLPQWLEMAPLNRLVLRHCPAQAAHGGSGAFYVYLKRDR